MFETAELGQKTSKAEYEQRIPTLRQELLAVQMSLRDANFPVVVMFAGVDGAGKSEIANRLQGWLDQRRVVTRAFHRPNLMEEERPEFWRYWMSLPPRGYMGVFLSAWYSPPLLQRVYRESTPNQLEERLERIVAFEKMLVEDGALFVKVWLHLGKVQQKKRFKKLERDPLESWRVTKKDWKHWQLYDKFIEASEQLIGFTSTGPAPWTIVECSNLRYATLQVGETILDSIQRRLRSKSEPVSASRSQKRSGPTILSQVDLSQAAPKEDYQVELKKLQGKINQLHRKLKAKGGATILVFEGWDAAGKGGAIRRFTTALEARDYEVISIAAPTDEEQAHHYLWRFWRRLPSAGRVTVFDRSWYGRVLVERVEGFANEDEWRRAYGEIRQFEGELVSHGIALAKFWIHIDQDEQARRFEARRQVPHKQWKLTDEDWRNRQKWKDYDHAVHDMVERTSTHTAPWTLVPGNDKRYARLAVLRRVVQVLTQAIEG